jgi:hypothetical protein
LTPRQVVDHGDTSRRTARWVADTDCGLINYDRNPAESRIRPADHRGHRNAYTRRDGRRANGRGDAA